jgi:hypothetical protein
VFSLPLLTNSPWGSDVPTPEDDFAALFTGARADAEPEPGPRAPRPNPAQGHTGAPIVVADPAADFADFLLANLPMPAMAGPVSHVRPAGGTW